MTRDEIILAWCRTNRADDPSVERNVRRIIESGGEAINFLIAICFAAGREFQRANPDNTEIV